MPSVLISKYMQNPFFQTLPKRVPYLMHVLKDFKGNNTRNESTVCFFIFFVRPFVYLSVLSFLPSFAGYLKDFLVILVSAAKDVLGSFNCF